MVDAKATVEKLAAELGIAGAYRPSGAQQQRFATWVDQLGESSARLAVIELGAGSAIPTVRQVSERVVQSTRGTLIRINPRENGVAAGQIGLPLGAADGIRLICEHMKKFAENANPRV